MTFEAWKASAARHPALRPLAAPLGWLMGRVRAPVRPPDLAGQWAGPQPDDPLADGRTGT